MSEEPRGRSRSERRTPSIDGVIDDSDRPDHVPGEARSVHVAEGRGLRLSFAPDTQD
jgi:hypothetical protein